MIDLTNMTTSLKTGDEYQLRFYATTCADKAWPRLGYAYIDFNGNGVYDDTELIGQWQVDNRVAPVELPFTFIPPCLGEGSVVGRTRMRVFIVESGLDPNPCLTFSYGGVKEFSIDILLQPGQRCGAPTPAPAPTPGYCKAGPTVTDSSNLGPVSLLGEVRSEIDDKTDCPPQLGIRDLTHLNATIMAGEMYTLTANVTTCGKVFNRYGYAFIDFNGNDVYEPSELLGAFPVDPVASPVPLEFRFIVPCLDKGSEPGWTRMRVFAVEGGRTPDPCLVFAYGGVKEYSILILSQQGGSCVTNKK